MDRVSRKIVMALLALVLSSCATMEERVADQSGRMANDQLSKSLAISEESLQKQRQAEKDAQIAKQKKSRQIARANLASQQRKENQARFNLNVEKSPIRPLLMSLVKGTGYNMIVDPSVQGEVSLSLKNVTVDEVMQALRNLYGYEFRRSAIGYEVLAAKMQTRIFKINYLNVKRVGVSQVRVSSGSVTGNDNKNSNKSKNSNRNKINPASQPGLISGSQINTRSNSDFWKEMQDALEIIIGEGEGRRIVVNSQAGVIVVRAMPGELHDAEDYLNAVEAIVERQVILEAKILEVTLNEHYQTGVNWAAFMSNGNNKGVIGQIGGGNVFQGDGVSGIAGNEVDLGNLSGAEGIVTSAFGGVFTLALELGDFTAFIEALENQGDVHVLSSPRVSTVNNQKAVIKVGTDEYYITDIETQTLESVGNLNQSINVELTPFFTGVALDVIPQINSNGEVTLHVHPSVSDVNEKVKEIQVSTGEDGILKVPLPVSTIRESDSIVRAHSGQVVVIGGLMQNLMSDETSGIPFLKDLPLVGGIFRHDRKVSKKSELVILLRPIVVDDNHVWRDYIENSRKEFDDLTRFEPHTNPEMESAPADSGT